jgi:hypothetical protein
MCLLCVHSAALQCTIAVIAYSLKCSDSHTSTTVHRFTAQCSSLHAHCRCACPKTCSHQGFSLDVYLSHKSAEEKATIVQSVMDLFESKVIQPSGFVGQMLPLTEFATAVADSSKDARGGKVFLYSS